MQIGEFQVLGELGRGAMAVVYHARSLRTGVDVALKLLAPGKNAKQRERFRREAEALMILNHPHIVGVHGFGEFNGSLYMAMELIPGEGLDERIERLGPLPVGYAIELFVPLAKALGHAHERRILHRDLKPANVLISASGKPYLADFGLAKDADSQGGDLTMEGALVGTPGFWSPEQALADSGNVGPATDIYGLGATLYACLTGRPPFEAASLTEMVIAVQDQMPPPPHKLRSEVPRALSDVCMRCLAKKPARRFGTGQQLAKALSEVLRGGKASQSVSRRGLAVHLLLGAVVVVSGVVWITRETPDEGGPASTVVEPDDPQPSVEEVSEAETREQLLARGRAAIDDQDALAARDAFSAVLQLDPDDPVALIGMGDAALLRDDCYPAIDYLNRGLEALPEDTQALISRGIAYGKLEQWEKSLDDLERALTLAPNDPRGHRNMGVLLAMRSRYEESLVHFSRAIERFEEGPGKTETHMNRAITLVQLRRFAEAEPDLLAVQAADPEREALHYMLGVVAFELERWAQAEQEFSIALERLPPSDVRHGLAKERLAAVRETLGR